MISYDPLWQTMELKGFTTYMLINDHKVSSRTINNLKHGKGITLYTLERLCNILNCEMSDIVEFKN